MLPSAAAAAAAAGVTFVLHAAGVHDPQYAALHWPVGAAAGSQVSGAGYLCANHGIYLGPSGLRMQLLDHRSSASKATVHRAQLPFYSPAQLPCLGAHNATKGLGRCPEQNCPLSLIFDQVWH